MAKNLARDLSQLESILTALEQHAYLGKAAFQREEDQAQALQRLMRAHARIGRMINGFQEE